MAKLFVFEAKPVISALQMFQRHVDMLYAAYMSFWEYDMFATALYRKSS